MEDKNLKKNYIYNLIYQILILIVPTITTPYISRALGAEAIGKYSYTQSIVTFFILFGSLGLNMYGQREIAYLKDDERGRSKVFWEILFVRFISIMIALLIYGAVIMESEKYKILFMIQVIDIVSASLDISWFFQGTEDFRKIIFRNTVVRLISVCLVFSFVHKQEDLYKYLLCMSIPVLVGNISLWIPISKEIMLIRWGELSLTSHIKEALSMFLPQVSIQVYIVLDKAMLGWIARNDIENGYYDQAQKLLKFCTAVVTAAGTVMASRVANSYVKGGLENTKKYIIESFNLLFFIAIPIFLGLVSVAPTLIPIFFGPGYKKVIYLIYILAVLNVVIGMSNVIGIQYLVPTRRQRYLTKSVTTGAIVNVVLNSLLIPHFLSVGASLASVVAEVVVTLIQLYYIRKEFSISQILKCSSVYWMAGFVMAVVVISVQCLVSTSPLSLVGLVIMGIIIYIGFLLVCRDGFTCQIFNALQTYIYQFFRGDKCKRK